MEKCSTFNAPFTNPNVYSSVNRVFKNQSSFFERGDRDVLKNRLEELLKNDTAIYLGEEKERIEKWANQWIEARQKPQTAFAKRVFQSN